MKVFHTDMLAFNLTHPYSAFFPPLTAIFSISHLSLSTFSLPHLLFSFSLWQSFSSTAIQEASSRVGNQDEVSKYLGHSLPLL